MLSRSRPEAIIICSLDVSFFSAFPNAIYLFGQPIIARDMTWSRNLQAPGSLEPECLLLRWRVCGHRGSKLAMARGWVIEYCALQLVDQPVLAIGRGLAAAGWERADLHTFPMLEF